MINYSTMKNKKPANNDPSLGGNIVHNNQASRSSLGTAYYCVIVAYCMFLITTGAIVIITPERWLSTPEIVLIVSSIADEIPGLVNLANLSEMSQLVMLKYCIIIVSMPVHILFMSIIGAILLRYGKISMNILIYEARFGWSFALITWLFWGTCLFCNNDHIWKAFSGLSPIMLAFLGQAWVALVAIYPAIFVVLFLNRYKLINQR